MKKSVLCGWRVPSEVGEVSTYNLPRPYNQPQQSNSEVCMHAAQCSLLQMVAMIQQLQVHTSPMRQHTQASIYRCTTCAHCPPAATSVPYPPTNSGHSCLYMQYLNNIWGRNTPNKQCTLPNKQCTLSINHPERVLSCSFHHLLRLPLT